MQPTISSKSKILTPREQEVIGLLCDGLKYKEAGRKLCISIETVRKHVDSIYKKLNVKNKAEAVMKVYWNDYERLLN